MMKKDHFVEFVLFIRGGNRSIAIFVTSVFETMIITVEFLVNVLEEETLLFFGDFC